jgi:hypothetical protein
MAVLAVLIGFAVVITLLVAEPSPYTAFAMAGAMISVALGRSFYDSLTNLGLMSLAAVAALGLGVAGWRSARKRRYSPGPYTVVATLIGGAMLGAGALGFVAGALFANAH